MSAAADKEKVVLYSYWRSSCSWRVRLVLALKGIPYEYEAVHLLRMEQRDPAFLSRNPTGQVPLLCVDGLELGESVAICEYLEETRPQHPLLPSSPGDRAQVRRVMEMINAGIQPKQNVALLTFVAENLGGPEEKKRWAVHWITSGLKAVEEVLEKTAGKCCVGDEVTMADCFLVPQIYNSIRFGIDMAQFPVVKRVVDHVSGLPGFAEAHADAQPDAAK